MSKIKQNLSKAFKAYADRIVKIYDADNYSKVYEKIDWEKERKLILNFIEKNIIYLDFPRDYAKHIIDKLWYAKGSVSINELAEEVLSFIEVTELIEEVNE